MDETNSNLNWIEKVGYSKHFHTTTRENLPPGYLVVSVPCLDIYFLYFLAFIRYHMSRVVRQPAFCICENKDADQLRSNCAADQRLCFRYTDSTIPILPKSEISSL